MLKNKLDTFHARYQNSPPSSETFPQRDSSSTSRSKTTLWTYGTLKTDALDSLPPIEKKTSMTSDPRSSQATHSVQYSSDPRTLDTSSRQNIGSDSPLGAVTVHPVDLDFILMKEMVRMAVSTKRLVVASFGGVRIQDSSYFSKERDTNWSSGSTS